MKNVKLYFKGWWRALTGRVYTYTFKEAYGDSNGKSVEIKDFVNTGTSPSGMGEVSLHV